MKSYDSKYHLPCPCGLSSDAYTEYDDGGYCFSCGKAFKSDDNSQADTLSHLRSTGTDTQKNKNQDRGLTTQELSDILSVYTIGSTLSSTLKDTQIKDTLLKDKKLKDDYNTLGIDHRILPNETIYDGVDNNTLGINHRVLPKALDKGIEFYMNDYRKISDKTLIFYGVKFKTINDTPFIFYPYRKGEGYKVRNLNKKEFFTEGDMKTAGLYGKDLFPAGGKALTITEGENDAAAVYQMNGGFPAVSVRSATQAVQDCKADYDYINSFDRIYLCFDSDDPGQNALRNVASLFNPNKVYHVHMNKYKDAHAYLEQGEQASFIKEWWAAKPYLPSGIVGDYDSIMEILEQESSVPVASYPYKRLQDMTYGIRLGEIILFTAQEKIGKTEVIRSIEYHLLKTTDYNLGIIHLEEPEKRTVQGLVGYELKTPVHFPDSGVSNTEALKVYKDLTKKDNRCYLYKHFGSDDPKVILDTIRYLVAVCDCKFIFLDHITMLVTGFEGDDERKKLDYLSTQLAMMTRELNFTLFLVSHVNDDGKTRGSRNISKVADLIIHLDRNIEASTISERNKTELLIKGNRWAGLSGPSSNLFFDQGTFTFTELEETTETEITEEITSSDHRTGSLWTSNEEQERS